MMEEKCEWCEKGANNRFTVSPKYNRFCCDDHYEKTRKLVFLDGHETATIISSTQPFKRKEITVWT